MDDKAHMLTVSNKANEDADEEDIASGRPEELEDNYRELSELMIRRSFEDRVSYGDAARQDGTPAMR